MPYYDGEYYDECEADEFTKYICETYPNKLKKKKTTKQKEMEE